MKNIEELIDDVFSREGKVYENVPGDNGGPTKFGITIHDLRELRGRATADDVRRLTEEQARSIYRTKYWENPMYDHLPAMVGEVMFDFGILHGTYKATRTLQSLLNEAGFGPIVEDGKMGMFTLSTATLAAREMGEYLVNALIDAREQHFDDIVAAKASQRKFLRGWYNRVEPLRRKIDDREYA